MDVIYNVLGRTFHHACFPPATTLYKVCSFSSISLKFAPLIGHNQGLVWRKFELDRVYIRGENGLRKCENSTLFFRLKIQRLFFHRLTFLRHSSFSYSWTGICFEFNMMCPDLDVYCQLRAVSAFGQKRRFSATNFRVGLNSRRRVAAL